MEKKPDLYSPMKLFTASQKETIPFFFFENHEKLMFTKSLKDVCKILPEEHFFRIHHSYVINLSFADKLIENGSEHEVVLTTGISLPVSRRKKADFLARFPRL